MNYKICITLLLAGTFVSCSKVLDKKPLDAFDENTIWQDKSLADGFVLTTYANVIGGLYFWQATDDMTDNNCNNYGNGVTTENIDNSYDAGWNQYSKIRSCNLIIEKVTASTGIMENDKKVMIAEAKFMRGITYYYLAQRFGGVMLVDKVLDQNSDDFQLPRSSPETIYEFILKDLSDAALDLPTTAPSGRASKAAAYAFITRVGLQGAAYVPAKKQEYLQSVITAAEKTFTYDYQLDADYAGMFNDFGKAQASREMILAYFRDATNTTFQSTIMQGLCPNAGNEKLNPGFGPAFTESFEGWPDRFPSQNLVDAYLVIDQDGSAKKWNQTTYYANYQASGGLASEVLYQHRDKRFGASVVYDSTKLYNNIVMTRDAGNMNRLSSSVGDWGVSESNYYYRKGLYEAKKVWYSDATNYSQAIIRLGEVYLNYAEALLLTGKITEAVTAINQTRQVHGGLPAIETTPSEDEAWDIYKNERRVDLLMENDRYWSLLRWAKFKGQIDIPELRETIRRVDISADGKTFSFADVTLNGNSDRVFTQRRFLFPVPISELQANPKLAPNNEGW